MSDEILRFKPGEAAKLFAQEKFKSVIYQNEQAAWMRTLGNGIIVKPLPEYVTLAVKLRLERLGMALHYIPALEPEENYPNWQHYEGMNTSDKANHEIPRNLNEWFWNAVKEKDIAFPALPGQWVAIESMMKPKYGDTYSQSPLTTHMGLTDRFNVSWNDAKEKIDGMKTSLLREVGLLRDAKSIKIPAKVQMLDALPWNLLANRHGWGETNTWEWTNTEFRGEWALARVIIGNSDNGGAAGANRELVWNKADNLGFRVAVIF